MGDKHWSCPTRFRARGPARRAATQLRMRTLLRASIPGQNRQHTVHILREQESKILFTRCAEKAEKRMSCLCLVANYREIGSPDYLTRATQLSKMPPLLNESPEGRIIHLKSAAHDYRAIWMNNEPIASDLVYGASLKCKMIIRLHAWARMVRNLSTAAWCKNMFFLFLARSDERPWPCG